MEAMPFLTFVQEKWPVLVVIGAIFIAVIIKEVVASKSKKSEKE